MNEILGQLPFSENEIDIQNYTANILLLCSANGILTDKKIQEIHLGLDKAFIETAEQYTKRESSTISQKCAERLYSSVLYQADVYLLSLQSLFNAVQEVTLSPIEALLDRGQKLILQLHENNLQIFRNAYRNRLNLPVYEYKYVMNKSFDEYYRGYSARFDARNCCAAIDYPLLGCPAYNMKTQGVLFIHEYYTGILHENEFCKYFSEEKIEQILTRYGEIYGCRYTDLLFNIAEVLLNNLLGGALLGKPLFKLSLNRNDIYDIVNQYTLSSEEAICNEIKKAFSVYQEAISNPSLYRYLQKYIPSFAQELLKRIEYGGAERFFVTE